MRERTSDRPWSCSVPSPTLGPILPPGPIADIAISRSRSTVLDLAIFHASDLAAWVSLGLDFLGLALLALYHLYLARIFRRDPERTYRGRSNRLRRAWVAMVRVRGADVLAVQTMRNWVMSATLLASTSILIGLAAGNMAFTGTDLGTLARDLSPLPGPSGSLMRLKVLALAGIFFSAFHHFALALRDYNHTGFMINLPDGDFLGDPVETVAETLNRAGGHYHKGTRIFLLALPFALWLIGSAWLLGGVALVLGVLGRFDFREPTEPGETQNDGHIGP
jgi:uncharacterized membrane protein